MLVLSNNPMPPRDDKRAPPRSSTQELIDSLRAEGAVDSEGTFTLDAAYALAKLRRFLLPDPRYFVLELVQAAVLRGAAAIHFRFSRKGVRVEFDGAPFTDAELARLPDTLLLKPGSYPEEGLRHLALALYTALELRPLSITMASGTTKLQNRRNEYGDMEPSFARSRLSTPAPQTSIEVGAEYVFAKLSPFLLGREVESFEARLLSERCLHARQTIVSQGQTIAIGHVLMRTIYQSPFAVDACIGLVGIWPYSRSDEITTVRLVRNGVLIETKEMPELLPGFVALVESPVLPLDLSHQHVVAGPELDTLRRQLLARQLAMLCEVCRRGLPASKGRGGAEHVRALLWHLLCKLSEVDGLALLLRWAGYAGAGLVADRDATLLDWPSQILDGAALIDTPLLRSTHNEFLPLRRLLDELRQHGFVGYSYKQGDAPRAGRSFMVYLSNRHATDVLGHLLRGVGCLMYRGRDSEPWRPL